MGRLPAPRARRPKCQTSAINDSFTVWITFVKRSAHGKNTGSGRSRNEPKNNNYFSHTVTAEINAIAIDSL